MTKVGLAVGDGGLAALVRAPECSSPSYRQGNGEWGTAGRRTGKATEKRHQPSSPSYRRRPVPSAACDEAPDAALLGA